MFAKRLHWTQKHEYLGLGLLPKLLIRQGGLESFESTEVLLECDTDEAYIFGTPYSRENADVF